MVLLPEEKEQSLREISDSVRATFATVSDALSTGRMLYRSIDQLPFVSLPFPSQAQVEQAGQSLAKLQTSVDELQKNIAQIRAGVSGKIDVLGGITDQILQQIGESRDRLAKLDARLANLQAGAERLQKSLQTAIILFSVLITLCLAYVIYTQVEIIRLFVQRWRAQNTSSNSEEVVG
jgi:chromosome segregation ATPase